MVSEAAARVAAAEPGAAPTTITPRVPVVAVTGTNGKTTTSRMIAHIAPRGRPAGRLVEHRRHLHRRRAGGGRGLLGPVGSGAGAGPPAGGARGHRDRPRRHPAQGDRADPQRRLGGHQRVRRPPRPPGHRHPRPARRGQGRRPPHHPEGGLGGPERRRPPGLRDARDDQGAALGVLPRPGLTGDPRGAVRRRPGHDGHRRLDLRAPAQPRPRPAGRAGRRADDAGRAVPLQRREQPRRRVGRAGGRDPARGGDRRAAHVPARTPSTTRAG